MVGSVVSGRGSIICSHVTAAEATSAARRVSPVALFTVQVRALSVLTKSSSSAASLFHVVSSAMNEGWEFDETVAMWRDVSWPRGNALVTAPTVLILSWGQSHVGKLISDCSQD